MEQAEEYLGGNFYQGISDCNNSGTIISTGKNINDDTVIGGITGYITESEIQNCNNNGEIIKRRNGNSVGGIVGILDGGKIINCHNKNSVTVQEGTANRCVGGIVGVTSEKEYIIKNCSNNSNIYALGRDENGNSFAGGIAGSIYKGNTENCINTGTITANGAYVGGIVGTTAGSVINSHNEGIVTVKQKNTDGNAVVGGIVGQLDTNHTKEATIEKCYNTNTISSEGDYNGGIVGFQIGGSIKNTYNTGKVTSSLGVVGGIASQLIPNTSNMIPQIDSCYNTGDIESKQITPKVIDSLVGGIAGVNEGNIAKCKNSGKISGISAVGGISGYSLEGSIHYCYNRGSLIANYTMVGGIVGGAKKSQTKYCYNTYNTTNMILGFNDGESTVENCYYLGTVTQNEVRREEDMKTNEFINLLGGTSIWKLDNINQNSGFIILNWQ